MCLKKALDSFDILLQDLKDSVEGMRRSTWELMLTGTKSPADFNDVLLRVKKGWGPTIPEQFILLVQEKKPQYYEQLRTFIIFE